jgi:hypothetical protein
MLKLDLTRARGAGHNQVESELEPLRRSSTAGVTGFSSELENKVMDRFLMMNKDKFQEMEGCMPAAKGRFRADVRTQINNTVHWRKIDRKCKHSDRSVKI